MSIWGKVLGGVGGFAIGGPIGALLGALGGHMVDKMREEGEGGDLPHGGRVTKSIGFTIGVIVLGAKMAKADGVVTRNEIDVFKRVFRIPEHEVKNVARLFNRARQDAAGFEPYAQQLAHLFQGERVVLEELLWGLSEIARADGAVDQAELDFLKEVAGIFGFGAADFERVTGLSPSGEGADPYAILGVPPDADLETIKAAHRKLVLEHHPDRLTAQGLPEEFIDSANRKLAQINEAWDRVKRMRNGS